MTSSHTFWNSESFKEFLRGIRAEMPILLGVAPLGMIYGALATAAGLSAFQSQAMSSIIFAGSAQFLLVQFVGQGMPPIMMILSATIINLRHLLYSASVAPFTRRLCTGWKLLLAYFLTDEVYAVTIMHYSEQSSSSHKHWFFLGAGLALWSFWQLSTATGIFLGAQIPADLGLDFTLALTFIALAVPAIKDRPSLLAALSAGVIALLTINLPYKLGLIAASLTGIAVGVWSEQQR